MKIFNKTGSKERLKEAFQNVNKIKLNETFGQTLDSKSVLESTFDELKNRVLNIKHTSTQVNGDESYVKLICIDNENNNITFTFKVITKEGDQEGVYDVMDAEMVSFSFDSADDEESLEMNENSLKEFNEKHKDEFYDIIDEYVDVEDETVVDELYEDVVKLIDKIPYNVGSEEMVTHQQYADEKPTNPKLRVDAEELKKFVKENETGLTNYLENIVKLAAQNIDRKLGAEKGEIPYDEYVQMVRKEAALILEEKRLAAMNEDYPKEMGKEFAPDSDYPGKKKKYKTKKVKIKEEEADLIDGEKQIKKSYLTLSSDMDYQKLSNAYIGLLKLQRGEFRESHTTQAALSSLRRAITEFLNTIKGLNVREEDVQNYFENNLQKQRVVNEKSINPEASDMEEGGDNPSNSNDDLEDVLLGFKPVNVGEEFDFAASEREYAGEEEMRDYSKNCCVAGTVSQGKQKRAVVVSVAKGSDLPKHIHL